MQKRDIYAIAGLISAAENFPDEVRDHDRQPEGPLREESARCSASPAQAAPGNPRWSTRSCAVSCIDFPDKTHRHHLASILRNAKTGGALLGDRIRMNAINNPQRLHALAGHPAVEPGRFEICERRLRSSCRRPAST
ncbi:MAG: hypothetical protein MZV63_41475 [Marinilabiliales bacterium]|nr:hypothetical protein [Marinilabiliales bacterium]